LGYGKSKSRAVRKGLGEETLDDPSRGLAAVARGKRSGNWAAQKRHTVCKKTSCGKGKNAARGGLACDWG